VGKRYDRKRPLPDGVRRDVLERRGVIDNDETARWLAQHDPAKKVRKVRKRSRRRDGNRGTRGTY
jgi:hypothetical protein